MFFRLGLGNKFVSLFVDSLLNLLELDLDVFLEVLQVVSGLDEDVLGFSSQMLYLVSSFLLGSLSLDVSNGLSSLTMSLLVGFELLLRVSYDSLGFFISSLSFL